MFKNNYKIKISSLLQIFFIFFSFGELLNTDAYYIPYLIVMGIAIACLCKNTKDRIVFENRRNLVLAIIFAIVFALMVTLSNYTIWLEACIPDYVGNVYRKIYKLFLLFIITAGSFIAFFNIFRYILSDLDKLLWVKEKKSPTICFFYSFLAISVIDIFVLVACKYPGNLSKDSISQIQQILLGNYSNHHPFYHTIVIKTFLDIGMKIFGDINVAICIYCVFQIIFIAICFSLTIMTFSEMGLPSFINFWCFLFYAAMPYHIMYSFTIWKDVLFGGFVLLFTLFGFRCINKLGNMVFDYLGLLLSSIGFCLFRSNGFFAFVLTVVCFALLWRLKEKRIITIMLTAIIISFFMKHMVLGNLGVSQPDTIEALSIPIQQIARVIVEYDDFSDTETELIEQIIDISSVPNSYQSYISDPIKKLIRQKGKQRLLLDKKWQYICMYLSIGMRHPVTYLKAWIDETRGYWNAGYSYWIYTNEIMENELGIFRTTNLNRLNKAVDVYLWLFSEVPGLQIFCCIGFVVWLHIVMLFIGLIRKDRDGVFAVIPLIMIVFSLLVSTPVYSEFRYAYSLFCTAPLIIVIALRPNELVRKRTETAFLNVRTTS